MGTISIADAKAHLSELVERAAAGDPVCITRRGKPVARITGIEGPRKRRWDRKRWKSIALLER